MLQELKHLIQTERGLAARLARAAGISRPYVWQCANGRRVLPERACPAFERELGARLVVERMRSDIRWVRVPDSHWPHPLGRPCEDYAGPADAPPAPPAPEETRDAV